ncbi:hypothetical protein PV413_03370 [Streptomyces scabiei]|uniref:hypothetical protein n=1 Tax=Streptomyces scabiei TaxID=1930 RepID=UPI000E68AA51|nr:MULTISPECIES: hypothetical protein [Streptomyces]MDX2749618.1 hypothetical protein [Streptomyces scabiei]MDX3026747.1 hypothetical protein [Streptomyces scabiei]MDX3146514.1 hypothetical protein [Streptomyces scabiei]MDX3196920.1 hypothetical protein [Streptomyces scabiei]MDX3208091.1 hypothetical protein [Streptomyces scabiei]
MKPLLLLDVDGPLNPFDAPAHRRPAGYQTHRLKPDGWIAQHPGVPEQRVKPLRVWLNPTHGPTLLALPFELVWATTWEHDANEWIGWRIGLPRERDLPVIEFGDQFADRPDGTYVKTWRVVEYAAGRPFVWVDDQITDVDRAYVDRHHNGPALLHWVDPGKGLTHDDFAVLTDWAARLDTDTRNGAGT